MSRTDDCEDTLGTPSGRAAAKPCWPVGLKSSSAMHIRNTERVLVENCHASKFNCEAFYCQGDD